MIEHIGFLTEILSILLCIHALYGKKFRLNIRNITAIGVDVILLQLISEQKIISEMSMVGCIIVFGYCIAEFGVNIRELVVNNILYIVIVSVLQVGAWKILETVHLVQISKSAGGINNIMINMLVILFIVLIFPHLGLHKISMFMQQKIPLLRILLIVALLFILYLLVIMKTTKVLFPENYVVITISLCLLGAITYMWQKNQFKVREQKMMLQMHQLYGEGYENLIAEVRRKQHDFHNHLNTIYSMHYTCHTYEELVKQQEIYMDEIQGENKYSKLLKIGNPIMIGFLYGKFLQAEQQGITVVYDIKIEDLASKIPIHKMVEMIGNLLDNAMDAVKDNDVEKMMYLDFMETSEKIQFKIWNESCYIPQEKILKMFRAGESSKGEHRGLGLANVKQICEEYKCDLQVNNRKEDTGKNYIEFNICVNKEL